MKQQEKQVDYLSTNTYLTLNELRAETRNIWMVFHGIGFLSRYFISYFDELDSMENYIIAPQAPSKYYLNNQYRHVGASWLTRENTPLEIGNILRYVNEVFKAEALPADRSLYVLGYSQGVSVALRWLKHYKIQCARLILYAGGIPEELRAEDFYFQHPNTRVNVIVGDRDEYLTADRMKRESDKLATLFGDRLEMQIYRGGHEFKKELLTGFLT